MKTIDFKISGDFAIRKNEEIILNKEELSGLLQKISEIDFSLPDDLSIETEQDTALGIFTVKVSSPFYVDVPLITVENSVNRKKTVNEGHTHPRKILKMISSKLKEAGISDENYQLFYYSPSGEFRLTFRST